MLLRHVSSMAAVLCHLKFQSLTYFYHDMRVVLCKNQPQNDLQTVIRTSLQRFITALLSVCVECVIDMKRIRSTGEGWFLSCALFLSLSLPSSQKYLELMLHPALYQDMKANQATVQYDF